jgi:hypothetical protein
MTLVDGTGIFEHALFDVPRRRDGYTTDDAARAVVLLCDLGVDARTTEAYATLLGFVIHAVDPSGSVHNRLGYDRSWSDRPGFGDHHGRAAWALGVAAARGPTGSREAALVTFDRLVPYDGHHLRPHALAALGASEVLGIAPGHNTAGVMLHRAADRLGSGAQPWPEPRLAYDNARLPEGLLTVGAALDRRDLVDRGLEMLDWLVDVETRDGRFSFTPAGGAAPGETRPLFDQQPVEAAAMAAACLRAWRITGEDRWAELTLRTGRWLVGENDAGVPLIDPDSGACADGLHRNGINHNRGAESTIAAASVLAACAQMVTSTPAPVPSHEERATGLTHRG